MTTLCYTLDEAARKLGWSETVLVRMSQYFKVPENAYEESGFLSFKGDLDFTDADIYFFNRLKEHLLAGDSLSNIKRRIVRDQSQEAPGYTTPHLEPLVASAEATFEDFNQGHHTQKAASTPSVNPSSEPMYAYPDGHVQPVSGVSSQVDAFDTEYLNTTFGEPTAEYQSVQPMRGYAYQPNEQIEPTSPTSSFSDNADVITQTADRQFEVYKERQRNQRTGFFQRLLNRVEKVPTPPASVRREVPPASAQGPTSYDDPKHYGDPPRQTQHRQYDQSHVHKRDENQTKHQAKHQDKPQTQYPQAKPHRDWQVIPSFMRKPKHDEPVLEDYPVIRKQETVLAQDAIREVMQPSGSVAVMDETINSVPQPQPYLSAIPVPSPQQQKAVQNQQEGYASQPQRPLFSRLTNAPLTSLSVFHQRHPQSVEWAGFIQEAKMVRPTVLDPELKMAARYLRLKALKTG